MKVLPQTTTWMSPENITLKEANHKRPHMVLFHLYEISSRDKSRDTESKLVVAREEGGLNGN